MSNNLRKPKAKAPPLPKPYKALKLTWKDCYQTPEPILDLVRKIGRIALDPCTSPRNPTKAQHFYSPLKPAPVDGAKWIIPSWREVTYVNWPYSQNTDWSRRVIEHATRVLSVSPGAHVIALANASSGTAWYSAMTQNATAVCHVRSRVAFNAGTAPYKKQPGNQWGTAIWYFGNSADEFAKVFGVIGDVTQPYEPIGYKLRLADLYINCSNLNPDEIDVARRVIDRLKLGKQRYGGLDLATDKRNWSKEKHEELLDMLIYSAIRELSAK